MNITWHGESFFRINVQKERNSTLEVAIEPFGKESDFKTSKVKADIIIEKEGKSGPLNADGKPFFISNPGEYEIGGVFVQRISYSPGKSFSLIEAEGIKVCHLGSGFALKELNSELMETVDKTDILMIPVGGCGGLEPKEAARLVSQIEPKIVIPMCFKISGVKEKAGGLKDFLKVMGVNAKEEVLKLNIRDKDLIAREGTEVVVLGARF